MLKVLGNIFVVLILVFLFGPFILLWIGELWPDALSTVFDS